MDWDMIIDTYIVNFNTILVIFLRWKLLAEETMWPETNSDLAQEIDQIYSINVCQVQIIYNSHKKKMIFIGSFLRLRMISWSLQYYSH